MRLDVDLPNRGVEYALRKIVDALLGKITFRDNVQTKLLQVTSGLSNTPFSVAHNLGVTPTFFICNPDQSAMVWAVQRDQWTPTTIWLACSAPSCTMTIVVGL